LHSTPFKIIPEQYPPFITAMERGVAIKPTSAIGVGSKFEGRGGYKV
jgi:hypothetical protein